MKIDPFTSLKDKEKYIQYSTPIKFVFFINFRRHVAVSVVQDIGIEKVPHFMSLVAVLITGVTNTNHQIITIHSIWLHYCQNEIMPYVRIACTV